MTSHPTRVSTRSRETTSSSIAPAKRLTVAWKAGRRSSSSRYDAAKTCTASTTSSTVAAMVATSDVVASRAGKRGR